MRLEHAYDLPAAPLPMLLVTSPIGLSPPFTLQLQLSWNQLQTCTTMHTLQRIAGLAVRSMVSTFPAFLHAWIAHVQHKSINDCPNSVRAHF